MDLDVGGHTHPRRRTGIAVTLSLLVTVVFTLSAIVGTQPVHSARSNQVQLTQSASNVDPAFSPDGKKIVYSSNESGFYQLFTMDASGRHKVQIAVAGADQRYPKWSSDGKYITYLSMTANSTQIVAVNSQTLELSAVTGGGLSNHTRFDLCQTGEKIVFDSPQSGKWEIYLANLNGSVTQLTHDGNSREPTWTPDCKSILFSSETNGQYKIYEMRADGQEEHQLTLSGGNDFNPVVSPNGMMVAYTSNVSGTRLPWLMNIDGQANHPIQSVPIPQKPGLGYSPEVNSDMRVEWRSDSRAILLGGSQGQVFTFYLNTTVLRYNGAFRGPSQLGDALVMSLAGPTLHSEPVWSPDGSGYAFISNAAGKFNIYLNVLVARSPNPYA